MLLLSPSGDAGKAYSRPKRVVNGCKDLGSQMILGHFSSNTMTESALEICGRSEQESSHHDCRGMSV